MSTGSKIESREILIGSVPYSSSISGFELDERVKEPCPLIDANKFYNQKKFAPTLYKECNDDLSQLVMRYLKKHVPSLNLTCFVKRTVALTRKYRYCMQTDLQRAWYIFDFSNIERLILKYIEDESIALYLISFYERIAMVEEEDYLYISNYSQYIFILFLKDTIPKNIKFSSFYDDIIVFGHSMDALVQTYQTISNVMIEKKMIPNDKKTIYTDITKNSLIMLNTVISVPTDTFDSRLKAYIEEKIDNDKPVNLYSITTDIHLYINRSVLKSDKPYSSDIKVIKRSFVSSIVSKCLLWFSNIKNINNTNNFVCRKDDIAGVQTVTGFDIDCPYHKYKKTYTK